MNCFDAAPEFIDEDNRRKRTWSPVSKEQMYNKHEALLPEILVKGRTILDLGCCLGATGHWCLSHGATHYTGIEFQAPYAEKAERLLKKYHPGKSTIQQMSIEDWLAQPNKPMFDVVCLLGVLYAFVDYFSILKNASDIAKQTIAIEGLYPKIMAVRPKFCGVAFLENQNINMATEESSLYGNGTRISPRGLEWLMKAFGFINYDGIILPNPITGSVDVYNRPLSELKKHSNIRYMMRFTRSEHRTTSLSQGLQSGVGVKESWAKEDH